MLSDEERAMIYAKALKIEEENNKLKSVITYFDEFGQECSREFAKTAVIQEYNQDGELVKETFGTLEEIQPNDEENLEKKTRSI